MNLSIEKIKSAKIEKNSQKSTKINAEGYSSAHNVKTADCQIGYFFIKIQI